MAWRSMPGRGPKAQTCAGHLRQARNISCCAGGVRPRQRVRSWRPRRSGTLIIATSLVGRWWRPSAENIFVGRRRFHHTVRNGTSVSWPRRSLIGTLLLIKEPCQNRSSRGSAGHPWCWGYSGGCTLNGWRWTSHIPSGIGRLGRSLLRLVVCQLPVVIRRARALVTVSPPPLEDGHPPLPLIVGHDKEPHPFG